MALLLSCYSTFVAVLPACVDNITVDIGLPADTSFLYDWITPYGKHYNKEITTDANGKFQLLAEDFAPGLWNPHIKLSQLRIYEAPVDTTSPLTCDPFTFTMCNTKYDNIAVRFVDGELPAIIGCNCEEV